MKFKVLELNAFGKFQDYRLELPDGIVVLEGDNESGKTTLFHFVLLMFYGNAGAERSNDIQKSLRKKIYAVEVCRSHERRRGNGV